MSLWQKIDADLKQAMISRDSHRAETLRFLKAALQYVAIEKKTEALGESDTQAVIRKQIKQRRESIEQFGKNGRPKLAEKEKKELEILEGYLPKQMPDAELEEFVRNEVRATGASSKKDFGRMMKLLTEKLAGQAEAKRVSDFLSKHLS